MIKLQFNHSTEYSLIRSIDRQVITLYHIRKVNNQNQTFDYHLHTIDDQYIDQSN